LGAKDKIPRGRNGFDQLKHMVREAEGAEYFYINENKVFDGTMLGFIQAVVRCKALPVKIRLYAANKAVEYEAQAGTHQFDETTGRVICYLPHNGRDPLHQSEEDSDETQQWYLDQLKKRKRASILDWDSPLDSS